MISRLASNSLLEATLIFFGTLAPYLLLAVLGLYIRKRAATSDSRLKLSLEVWIFLMVLKLGMLGTVSQMGDTAWLFYLWLFIFLPESWILKLLHLGSHGHLLVATGFVSILVNALITALATQSWPLRALIDK